MSSFSGLNTALTGLMAHRRALDVTGQNIANVNTVGYTRQRVDLAANPAPGASSLVANDLLAGGGVQIVGTSRLADEFLTARVRSQTSTHADLQARAETLTEVERLLSEPGERGIAAQLSEMWTSWSTLAAHPTGDGALAAREVLVEKTQHVLDSLKSGARSVDVLWTDQRTRTDALATEVNELTGGIARLNGAVVGALGNGGGANELMDQRDQMVTRLVELTGALAVPKEGGVLDVYLDGNPVVAGLTASAVVVAGAGSAADAATDPVRLARADGGPAITVRGGQFAGALDALNTTLPGATARYDEVAGSLRTTVNDVYATTGGGELLVGTTAANTAIAADVVADPGTLRAGQAGRGPSDSSVAAAIADLRTAADGPDARWQGHVVDIGVRTQSASATRQVLATTLAAAVADQQSATGVSLDEETANLLVVQRAYEGAARVLTAVDQALDTLINRTGLVGR